MSRGPRHLSPEETRLWRRVTARDKPLRPNAEPTEHPENLAAFIDAKPAKPAKLAKPRPEIKPPASKTLAKAPLIARAHNFGEERKVRRGKLDVEGRIDLHGMTQRAAEGALLGFLQSARAADKRCVLVITGKGSPEACWPEPQRGVLRRRLPEWLDGFARDGLVSGYAPAHRTHGGEGAFYVFLKQRGK